MDMDNDREDPRQTTHTVEDNHAIAIARKTREPKATNAVGHAPVAIGNSVRLIALGLAPPA
jgi:hypothetical protein